MMLAPSAVQFRGACRPLSSQLVDPLLHNRGFAQEPPQIKVDVFDALADIAVAAIFGAIGGGQLFRNFMGKAEFQGVAQVK